MLFQTLCAKDKSQGRKIYMKSKVITFLVAATLSFPFLAFAQQGLVPCSGEDCTVCHLWQMFDNIVKFLVQISFAAGALGVAVGGFFIMTAGGSENRIRQGREILKTVIVGILIVLLSWVVLNTLFQILAKGIQGWDPRFWYEIRC
jgi:hypothetical protein